MLTTILKDYPYSMKLGPGEDSSHLMILEIVNILLNPKIHYHAQKCTQLVPILSPMNPVHSNFNVIL